MTGMMGTSEPAEHTIGSMIHGHILAQAISLGGYWWVLSHGALSRGDDQ